MRKLNRRLARGAVLIAGIGAFSVTMAQSAGAVEQMACLTEAHKALVGQELDAVQEQLPEQARIIPPDSAVTQDYLADRINVDLDEDGIIIRLWCG